MADIYETEVAIAVGVFTLVLGLIARFFVVKSSCRLRREIRSADAEEHASTASGDVVTDNPIVLHGGTTAIDEDPLSRLPPSPVDAVASAGIITRRHSIAAHPPIRIEYRLDPKTTIVIFRTPICGRTDRHTTDDIIGDAV